MRIPCAHCPEGESFDNLLAFHFHYKVKHKGIDFVCAFDLCHRRYDEWKSFQKHLKRDHNALSKPSENSAEARNTEGPHVPKDCDVICETPEPELTFDAFPEMLRSLKNFVRDELPDDVEAAIYNEVDLLVAKLCSKLNLPRSMTTSIIHDFSAFFTSGIFKKVSNVIQVLLETASVSNEEKGKIERVFELLSHPFDHVKSDYLRKRHFEKSGHYIAPITYTIHTRMENARTKAGKRLRMTDVTGQFVPLRDVLKKMFELPGFHDEVVGYTKSLMEEEHTISNFMQSECFKRKRALYPEDCEVYALLPYFDDFQPNAALGPHLEKLGAVYAGLPFLPPTCRSKLENILLVQLFNSDDRTLYGNKEVFKPLIDELEFLATTGICVSKPDGSVVRIFFVAGALLGDNLGLNGYAGYIESFNGDFYCRTCKMPKALCRNSVKEDVSKLRTPEDYRRDVLLNDPSQTGIKERCVFDVLAAFETPTDIGWDPFHDINEGIDHYSMSAILKHFHIGNKLFLENLNDRMYFFDFQADSDNKPPSILPEHLENKKLKMTGAEMSTFVRLLGGIIGDLVEESDPFWHLWQILHDISTICNSQRLPRNIGPTLELFVEKHHSLYMELTGNALKPKFHFVTHYNSRTLRLMGPPALMSTIRYESKHKALKSVANVCCSRVNLPMTVAAKEQEELCYRFKSQQPLRPSFDVGPGVITDLRVHEQFPCFSLTLPESVFDNVEHQLSANWVNFNNAHYVPKMALFKGFDEVQYPQFVRIEMILVCTDHPVFLCSPLRTVALDSHTRSIIVEEIPYCLNWYCLSLNSIPDPIPLSIYRNANYERFIVPKHVLIA